MSKSTKIAVISRVNDVLRLILAGAEFSDIRQFASQNGWNVSQRQIRRYIERAHRQFSKTTHRDREQLLGRHLMQRRAIYARAIRADDLKTALQVLRDEAALQGLYPSNSDDETSATRFAEARKPALSRCERIARWLAAEAAGDRQGMRLVNQDTPRCFYTLADTDIPLQILCGIAMTYVIGQLESVAILFNARLRALEDRDNHGIWKHHEDAAAYSFRVGHEAWHTFCAESGIDGDYLVSRNYLGSFLGEIEARICSQAPDLETLRAQSEEPGIPHSEEFLNADSLTDSWRRLYRQSLSD
ncbi:MAG: hypothetical protein MPJ50_18500 [Pirellulales bacterium]|nr:hypothetical protein [Pirellulales bacterium]